MAVDDLVDSITPCNPRPLLLHGYIGILDSTDTFDYTIIELLLISITKHRTIVISILGPFAVIFGTWLYVWGAVYGFADYFEAGCIVSAMIGLLQIITVLFCHWFVSIRCLMTCNRVCILINE